MLLFQVQNPQEMTIAPFFAGHNIRARGFSNAPGKRRGGFNMDSLRSRNLRSDSL